MATKESSKLYDRDPKLVEAEAENIRRIKGIKQNNSTQASDSLKQPQNASGAMQANLPSDPASKATVGVAEAALETNQANTQSQSNILDNSLKSAQRILDRRLGITDTDSQMALQEQQDLLAQGQRDLETERTKATDTFNQSASSIQSLGEEAQRGAQFQAALSGRSSFAAANAVQSVIDQTQSSLTQAQKDFFTSNDYLSNLSKSLSENAIREVTKINIDSSNKSQEAIDDYMTAVEEITEGKRSNEQQKALIASTIGAKLQKDLIKIQSEAAATQRDILKDERQFSLDEASFNLDAQKSELTRQGLNFDIDKFNITEERLRNESNVNIKTKLANIQNSYRQVAIQEANLDMKERDYALAVREFSADQSNLERELDLKEAKQALEESEVAWEQGIKDVEFDVDGYADEMIDNPEAFGDLSTEAKGEVSRNLFSRGISLSKLGDDTFHKLAGGERSDIAKSIVMLNQLNQIRAMKENVDTGPLSSAAQGVKEYLPSGKDSEYNAIDQFTGLTLANFIKSISGAAVSKDERINLTKLLPSTGQQDKTFSSNLTSFEQRLRTELDSKANGYGFSSIDELATKVGVKDTPSLFDALPEEIRKKYIGAEQSLEEENMKFANQFLQESGVLSADDSDYIDNNY